MKFGRKSIRPLAGKSWRCGRIGNASATLIFLAGFVVPAVLANEPTWTPLREVAGQRIHMGTAVKYDLIINNADYRAMVVREYDLVTPENAMKWGALRPDEKTFDFHQADAIVEFAQSNHIMVRGHNLCWNEDKNEPKWLLAGTYTPQQARELLKAHIQTVMAHYRGKVFCWDVVNEAVANNPKDANTPLNDGFWMRHLGPEYVELAFRYAHEADPQAELFYNDYDLSDPMGPKSDRIYQLVKSLKARGVPVDGVGLQSHYNLNRPPIAESLQADLQRYAVLGLKVHLTELDVQLEGNHLPLDTKLNLQAKIYADVTRAALSTPACEAIVTWGFSDRWGIERFMREAEQNGTEFPQRLPFDRELKPKPAAFAMASALSEANLRPGNAPPKQTLQRENASN